MVVGLLASELRHAAWPDPRRRIWPRVLLLTRVYRWEIGFASTVIYGTSAPGLETGFQQWQCDTNREAGNWRIECLNTAVVLGHRALGDGQA